MAFYAITDKGIKRERNEDAFFVDQDHKFFILADGMGGLANGALASAIAVAATKKFLQVNLSSGKAKPSSLLKAAIDFANKMVIQKAVSMGASGKMGTTLLVGMIENGVVHCSHVGDSRLYIVGRGLRLLTSDHTVGFNFIKENKLSPNKLPTRLKSLTQAIGLAETLEPEYVTSPFGPRDILLACSDGLTDMIDEHQIMQCFDSRDVAAAGDCLVAAANDNGGKDNVTVVMYDESWRANGGS